MQMFRAYLLDERGKIRLGDWIEASNEGEALARAKDMWREDAPRVEVWLGAEKLCEGGTC